MKLRSGPAEGVERPFKADRMSAQGLRTLNLRHVRPLRAPHPLSSACTRVGLKFPPEIKEHRLAADENRVVDQMRVLPTGLWLAQRMDANLALPETDRRRMAFNRSKGHRDEKGPVGGAPAAVAGA